MPSNVQLCMSKKLIRLLFAIHLNSGHARMREKIVLGKKNILCIFVSMTESKQFWYYPALPNFCTRWHIAREVLGLKLKPPNIKANDLIEENPTLQLLLESGNAKKYNYISFGK